LWDYFFYKLNVESENELIQVHITLSKKSQELEKEKNILRIQNDIIQTDLQMAQKIQKTLLPPVDLNKKISWYYQPMNSPGGDFIKFIFPDNDLAEKKALKHLNKKKVKRNGDLCYSFIRLS